MSSCWRLQGAIPGRSDSGSDIHAARLLPGLGPAALMADRDWPFGHRVRLFRHPVHATRRGSLPNDHCAGLAPRDVCGIHIGMRHWPSARDLYSMVSFLLDHGGRNLGDGVDQLGNAFFLPFGILEIQKRQKALKIDHELAPGKSTTTSDAPSQ